MVTNAPDVAQTGLPLVDRPLRPDRFGVRIRGIETVPVRAPLAWEFRGSYYRMTQRATLVVRVLTDAGVVGGGYVGDEDASAKEIESVLLQEIAPRVTGLDVLATEQCWQAGYPATFDILRDHRIGLVALAALDIAVCNAVGKVLGQPVWRLWGAPRRADAR